jgi:hypothetical protein
MTAKRKAGAPPLILDNIVGNFLRCFIELRTHLWPLNSQMLVTLLRKREPSLVKRINIVGNFFFELLQSPGAFVYPDFLPQDSAPRNYIWWG